MEDTSLPDPGFTPYYDKKFFDIIKYVRAKTPLNPVQMGIKEWYRLLLERNVTRIMVDQEDRSELVPCKVEEKNPEVRWPEVYRLSRLRGLSPENKSFLFKIIHLLLPSKERINHITLNTSPLCWCNSGDIESYHHLFFSCEYNRESGQALLQCIRSYDRGLTETKVLRLELETEEPFMLASVSLLATGLQFIWDNRKSKYRTPLYSMRAELEAAISIRRRSRLQKLRETADIMENMIDNFLIKVAVL